MPQQSWIIGSDPSCDLVVNSATVSGQHCRLTREGAVLTLTDLDSTNGTFVNGQALRGSRQVATTDRITLGQTQRMPWPEELKQPEAIATPASNRVDTQSEANRASEANAPSSSRQVITIGRGPDNTVVLTESNVSTNHARLIIDGDQIVLEDLGSTNGTSVGTVENKTHRALVKREETIFLGSTAYSIAELLSRAEPIHIRTVDRPSNRESSKQSSALRPAILAAIGGGAVTCGLVLWFMMRDSGVKPTQSNTADQRRVVADDTPASMAAVPSSKARSAAETERASSVERNAEVASAEQLAQESDTAGLSPQERLSRSLFVLVCTDPERETPFRVGTGFAIDAQNVVTSAAVIEAMRGLGQNGLTEAFLFSPAMNREVAIETAKIHPRFRIANTAARQAQQDHDAIFDELESQPPSPETLENVKEKLLAARAKALQAIDTKTSYDVAIVRVGESLDYWLTGMGEEATLRPKQKLQVVGYAFDVEDPFFDRSAQFERTALSGRVGRLFRSTQDSATRMLAEASSEQYEYAYFGSPAMNAKGEVVGVYSRPTPSAGEDETGSSGTYDAALFERVRECLAARD